MSAYSRFAQSTWESKPSASQDAAMMFITYGAWRSR